MDAPSIRFVVRLYRDKHFLKDIVASWGWMAPLGSSPQALACHHSPSPARSRARGGALFGTWWGLFLRSIGHVGTLACFGIGRSGASARPAWLSGAPLEPDELHLEAEGVILCFILYLIPGFPKDIVSYLFGLSPMPFWVFAVVSTLGRVPGTWISSYFGANVAEQQYIYAAFFIALVMALCLPIYYYRDRIIKRFHGKRPSTESDPGKVLDGRGGGPVE